VVSVTSESPACRPEPRPLAPHRALRDSKQSIAQQVDDAVAALKRLGSKRARDELGPRYGIHVTNAVGWGVGQIQNLAKEIGRNHGIALALWDADGAWHEVRMLAAFVDEPQFVTRAQMDRWCRDFDNWGIVDTVCFKLFDQVPFAFDKAHQWSMSPREFIKARVASC
jgi:3-methyladenine DNA glycosylase AlkD